MSAEQNVMDAQAGQEQRAAQEPESFANQGGESSGGDGPELDENGQRTSHGMGQSKSSRRRRRKRKMKAAEIQGGGSPEGDDGESPEASEPGEASSNAAQASSGETRRDSNGGGRAFQNGNGGQQAQPANGAAAPGTKRWKKKFRDRDRPRGGDNPGNQAQGGGFRDGGSNGHSNGFNGQFRGADTHQPGNNAFKRKGGGFSGKQGRSNGGGSRGGFVGPMDHSYRAPGGAFGDLSPSTMDTFGGRKSSFAGDAQPIDYSQGRNVPIAADAPTHIYFFIEDLFITAKIQETARKLGVKVAFIKNDKDSVAQLLAAEENDKPSLIVFDLNNAAAKPMTLMPKIKAKLKKSVSIIGFLSHLQGDLKAKAMESGCDTVMPRAAFSQNLPNLLRRYGIEETEEVANFNQ